MRGKRWLLVAVIGVALLLAVVGAVVVGAGWATFVGLAGGSGEADTRSGPVAHVALGEGRALRLEGTGVTGDDYVVERVEAGAAAGGWRWQAPAGYGAHPWEWRRAGDHVVGELHPVQGEGPHRLVILHIERGYLGELSGVGHGSWTLVDGALLASVEGALVEQALGDELTERWRAPIGAGDLLARVAMDDTYAYVHDGSFHVVVRATGALAHESPLELVGIDPARGEVLARSAEGRIEAIDVATETARLTLDVAGGPPVVDGMWEPELIGTFGGKWLLVYATEMDTSVSVNAAHWMVCAPRFLVAVDPESGEVAWRTELGRFPRWRPLWPSTIELAQPLVSPLLVHGDSDVEGGSDIEGHLVSIGLDDGAVLWRTDYPGATRSNALFATSGDVSWLRVRDEHEGDRTALARFEGARFTGAVVEPTYSVVHVPALTEDEAWIPGDGGAWSLARGATLAIAASSPGATRPDDAASWVRGRLRLPE